MPYNKTPDIVTVQYVYVGATYPKIVLSKKIAKMGEVVLEGKFEFYGRIFEL